MDKMINQVTQIVYDLEEGTPFTLFDISNLLPEVQLETLRTFISRLVNQGLLKRYNQGIFYKPQKSIFGETPLSKDKILNKFYLENEEDGVRGYLIGAYYLNAIGAATNIPNKQEIVTNNYLFKTPIKNMKNPPKLIKPKTKITEENAPYLQLLDTLAKLESYHVTVENFDEFLLDVIQELDVLKLIGYAKAFYPKKVLDLIENMALQTIEVNR